MRDWFTPVDSIFSPGFPDKQHAEISHQLHLPLHFFPLAHATISAGNKLARIATHHPPAEQLLQVSSSLDNIIDIVDHSIDHAEISDANLIMLFCMIYAQVAALYIRDAILQETSHRRRCIHLCEVLPHFCVTQDAHLLAGVESLLTSLLGSVPGIVACQRDVLASSEDQLGLPPSWFGFVSGISRPWSESSDGPAYATELELRMQTISDLEEATKMIEHAVEGYDPDIHGLVLGYALLISIGKLHRLRFLLSQDVTELDRSVSVVEIAAHFSNSEAHQRLMLEDISTSFQYRYASTRNLEVLDRVVETMESLYLIANLHPRPNKFHASNFANWLFCRLEARGFVKDGNRVLQLCEEISSRSVGEADPDLLLIQFKTLLTLTILGEEAADWSRPLHSLHPYHNVPNSPVAMNHSRKDIEAFLRNILKVAVTRDNPSLANELDHEISLWSRCDVPPALPLLTKESDPDLDHIIEAFERRCPDSLHTGDQAPGQASYLTLSHALFERYTRHRQLGDLQQAVAFRSPAGPLGTACFDVSLFRAAQEALDPIGVHVHSEEVAKSHEDHSDYPRVSQPHLDEEPYILHFYAHTLLSDSPHGGNPHNLFSNASSLPGGVSKSGVQCHRTLSTYYQVTHLPRAAEDQLRDRHTTSHPQPTPQLLRRQLTCLKLASNAMCTYFSESKRECLEEAFDYYQELVDSLKDDDQGKEAWRWRVHWAQSMCIRYFTHTCNSFETCLPGAQLLTAENYIREASSKTNHFSHRERLLLASTWFSLAPRIMERGLGRDLKVHIPQACELVLSLMEEQAWAAFSTRSSIKIRHEVQGLMTAAVVCASRVASTPADFSRCIEILEAGRSLLWNQATSLRAPQDLDKLVSVNPGLACRLQELSAAFQKQMGLTPLSQPGIDPTQTALLHERNQLLREIRALSGFEDFLKARPITKFLEAAIVGYAVILVPSSEQCLAFILSWGMHAVITLPISSTTLKASHDIFRSLVGARDAGHPQDGDGGSSQASPLMGTPPRGFKKTKGPKEEALYQVLEALWKDVAVPVLECILTKFEGKASNPFEKPRLCGRKRIWWCCVGEFSFLPIHAAGIYHDSTPVCVSDYFISSYTPTLGALFDAFAKSESRRKGPNRTPMKLNEIKVLAAVQPNPGFGWTPIPQVKHELEEIVKALPPECLIPLGGSNGPDYEGTNTTLDNVIAKLPEAHILHLACHATQDTADPLRSGFVLANGKRLTVEELMKHHFPNARIAILTACHTASNDAMIPEESINVATAMISAGFSNIIATKWPMNDADGPTIAKAVYRSFTETQSRVVRFDVLVNILAAGYSWVISKELQKEDTDNILQTIFPLLIQHSTGGCFPARAVVHQGFSAVSSEPLPDSAAQTIREALVEYVDGDEAEYTSDGLGVSLARVVDEVTRHLRVTEHLPPSRWATFVHVGM